MKLPKKSKRLMAGVLFCLLLLSVFLYLNRYSRPVTPEWKDFAQKDTLVVPKDTLEAIPEEISVPKPLKPVVTASVPEPRPMLQSEPLACAEVGRVIAPDLIISPDLHRREMHDLLATLPPAWKIHRFYIPPVDYKLNPKDLIIPGSMLVVSLVATNTDKYRDFIPGLRKNPKNRETPFDDIAQLVPSMMLPVFDIFADEKHSPFDQLFLMGMSYGLTVLPVRLSKNHYESERPYGGNASFPSGHTATAFVGSHMIYKEFKDSNPVIAYSGYALGAVTAVARVVNDKHWVSDVVAGAAVAILATELAYFIYFPVRNLITNGVNSLIDKYFLVTPMVYPQTLGLNVRVAF